MNIFFKSLILILFTSVSLNSQISLSEASQYLMEVCKQKNYELILVDISNEKQLIFSEDSKTFVEFENDWIENKNDYTFFNKSKIEKAYVGFYLKHNQLWDTYNTEFILKLPSNLYADCANENIKVHLNQVCIIQLKNSKSKSKTLEERKTLAILYLAKALETNCENVSVNDLNGLSEFDVMPLGDIKLIYGEDKSDKQNKNK